MYADVSDVLLLQEVPLGLSDGGSKSSPRTPFCDGSVCGSGARVKATDGKNEWKSRREMEEEMQDESQEAKSKEGREKRERASRIEQQACAPT